MTGMVREGKEMKEWDDRNSKEKGAGKEVTG